MRKIVSSAAAIILAIVMSNATTLPFSAGVLVILYVWHRDSFVFFVAFILGLILDSLFVRDLGRTSFFFLVFLFVLFLYERKFEVNSLLFVFIASFIGGLSYLIFFGYSSIFLQALVSSLFAVVLFFVIRVFFLRKTSELN